MRAWNNNTFGQFQTRKGAIYECFFSSVEPQKFEPIVDANEYKSGSPSITELRAFCGPKRSGLSDLHIFVAHIFLCLCFCGLLFPHQSWVANISTRTIRFIGFLFFVVIVVVL